MKSARTEKNLQNKHRATFCCPFCSEKDATSREIKKLTRIVETNLQPTALVSGEKARNSKAIGKSQPMISKPLQLNKIFKINLEKKANMRRILVQVNMPDDGTEFYLSSSECSDDNDGNQ